MPNLRIFWYKHSAHILGTKKQPLCQQSIRRHSVRRGMFPANQLARKHPFILNAKIEPLQWAKMAVRGRLPAYAWGDVLADIKANTGTFAVDWPC